VSLFAYIVKYVNIINVAIKTGYLKCLTQSYLLSSVINDSNYGTDNEMKTMTLLPQLLMMMMFGSRSSAIVGPPWRMLKNVKIVKNSTTIQNNKCPRRKCRKKRSILDLFQAKTGQSGIQGLQFVRSQARLMMLHTGAI